jgi:hypothetical protein
MLLKSDPVARSETGFHFAEHDESFAITEVQDVQAVLESNEMARRNYTEGARSRHGEYGSFAGRIPTVIWNDLVRRGIAFDDEALLAWLELPENRAFKIHPGRFSKGPRGRQVFA